MTSMMNRFIHRQLQHPVARPSAGSAFREATHQETSTVSGGFFFLGGCSLEDPADVEHMVTNYEYWKSMGVPMPPIK